MFSIAVTVFVFVFACVEGKPSEADEHIVGGEEVDIEDYPYQVSMQLFGKHRCGGSIISQTSILTAAHCTDGLDSSSNIAIRAGSSIYSSGGVLVKVNDIIQHTSYNPEINDYDIAIMNLETPLTYGSAIQPIDLTESPPMDNTCAIATGWGKKSDMGIDIDTDAELLLHLHSVDLYTLNQEACQLEYYYFLTDQQLCAYRDSAGSCQGDSGGPLAVLTPTSKTLIGIVSCCIGCARQYPTIYTNVSTLWEWIQDNMIPD